MPKRTVLLPAWLARHSALVVWLWLIVVLVLCVIPINAEIPDFRLADKLVHALFYATPAILLGLAGKLNTRWLVILIGWGVGIECVQHFLPWRSGDVYDALANSLGVVFGWLVAVVLCQISEKKP